MSKPFEFKVDEDSKPLTKKEAKEAERKLIRWAFVVDTEPLWCEDCRYFTATGMDGEGECNHANPRPDVWYGRLACSGFKPKEV